MNKPAEYFDGVRYKCVAHYPKLEHQATEWFSVEHAVKSFIEDHTHGGANVEVFHVKWEPRIIKSSWHKSKT